MAAAEDTEISPLNGAKEGTKTLTRWTNERLITASIGHITRFNEELLAKDLELKKMWKHVTGLSISGNRRIMELELDTTENARLLLDQGLNTHGRTLMFREATTDKMTVSLLGVPLGFPDRDIKDELTCYGDIDRLYRLTKTIHGRTLPTGTVIMKFNKLHEPIPKNIDIADRRIRTIYTGQDRHIMQWQQLKAQHTDADSNRRQQNDRPTDNTDADNTPTNADNTPTNDERQTKTTEPTATEVSTPSTQPAETTDDNREWYLTREQAMETGPVARRKRSNKEAGLSDSDISTAKTTPQGKEGEKEKSLHTDEQLIPEDKSNKAQTNLSLNQPDEQHELKREIRTILKPGSASFTEIVNFVRNRANDYRDFYSISSTLTGLTIKDEIDDFLGLVLLKGNGSFAKKKLSKVKNMPENVLDEWHRLSALKHVDVDRKVRNYTFLIQREWEHFK